MPNDVERQVLPRGDSIIPTLLYGVQTVPVAAGGGALPEATKNGPEQVRKAVQQPSPPQWALDFAPSHAGRAAGSLAALRSKRTDDPSRFDLLHRLDDFTLIGAPHGKQLPVLHIARDAPFLRDPSGEEFVAALQQLSTTEVSNAHMQLRIELTPMTSLPTALHVHQPRLVVVERWRLAAALKGLEVGNPIGTVALAPGESREVEIRLTRKETLRTKHTDTVLERITLESTESFNDEFTRQVTRNESETTSLGWERVESANFLNMGRTTKQTRDQSLSTGTVAEMVEKTVHSLVDKVTQERSITIQREFERTTEATEETFRKLKLANPSTAFGLTLVYHYLNVLWSVHVDLIGIELWYSGASADDGPSRLPLDRSLQESLARYVHADALAVTHQAVLRELRGRYEGLAVADGLPDAFVLKRPPPDDVNGRLQSRRALLDARRMQGALPVCVRSFEEVMQTEGLHVEPLTSAAGIPATTADKPKE